MDSPSAFSSAIRARQHSVTPPIGSLVQSPEMDMKLDDFALMVSEGVTNAVKHGSPEADRNIGLRLEGDQDALRVVVTEGGQVFAIDPGSLDPDRDESFGLLLVDKLADRWGYSLDGKKAIWLEVNTPSQLGGIGWNREGGADERIRGAERRRRDRQVPCVRA